MVINLDFGARSIREFQLNKLIFSDQGKLPKLMSWSVRNKIRAEGFDFLNLDKDLFPVQDISRDKANKHIGKGP